MDENLNERILEKLLNLEDVADVSGNTLKSMQNTLEGMQSENRTAWNVQEDMYDLSEEIGATLESFFDPVNTISKVSQQILKKLEEGEENTDSSKSSNMSTLNPSAVVKDKADRSSVNHAQDSEQGGQVVAQIMGLEDVMGAGNTISYFNEEDLFKNQVFDLIDLDNFTYKKENNKKELFSRDRNIGHYESEDNDNHHQLLAQLMSLQDVVGLGNDALYSIQNTLAGMLWYESASISVSMNLLKLNKSMNSEIENISNHVQLLLKEKTMENIATQFMDILTGGNTSPVKPLDITASDSQNVTVNQEDNSSGFVTSLFGKVAGKAMGTAIKKMGSKGGLSLAKGAGAAMADPRIWLATLTKKAIIDGFIKGIELFKHGIDLGWDDNLKELPLSQMIYLGNDGISREDAKEKADKYEDWVQDRVKIYGREDDELKSAGTRALQFSNGDVGEAKDLMNRAADVAGRSGIDLKKAVEILADAKYYHDFSGLASLNYEVKDPELYLNGEFEWEDLVSTKGVTWSDAYDGGTEAYAQTSEGSITRIEGMITDPGMDLSEELDQYIRQPFLDYIAGVVTGVYKIDLTNLYNALDYGNGYGSGYSYLKVQNELEESESDNNPQKTMNGYGYLQVQQELKEKNSNSSKLVENNNKINDNSTDIDKKDSLPPYRLVPKLDDIKIEDKQSSIIDRSNNYPKYAEILNLVPTALSSAIAQLQPVKNEVAVTIQNLAGTMNVSDPEDVNDLMGRFEEQFMQLATNMFNNSDRPRVV